MTRRKWTIFGIALIAFLAVFWAIAARHQTPSEQPPLADVTQQTMGQVRQEFNASSDSERVLLLLSPTCPVCIKGSSTVNEILSRHPGSKIRVIAIWEPMLPTDWNRPTSAVLNRLSDRRATQWWDNRHLIANLLDASIAGQKPESCKLNGTLWDVIAVYPPGVKWTETLPTPRFFAGPVVQGAPKWETQINHHS
jgi:hypothetical protein